VHQSKVRPDPHDRAHEERLCRRAELEFGYALPTSLGAPVIERAQQSLEMPDEQVAPEIDWAEAQRRQNAVDDAASARSEETTRPPRDRS
jgi:hypothetical protein